jgi:hypothetical protein
LAFSLASPVLGTDRWWDASHHRWHCIHHTAPPVKIYLLTVPRNRHSRFRYCPIYGVFCIDGSSHSRRTGGYFPWPLPSRTQERPTAGRPPIHVGRNATHSRPLVLADQGVVESLSFAPPYAFRLSEMVNAACKQSTRRPALACERGISVNPPSYTRARR